MTQGGIGKMWAEIFKWHPTKTRIHSITQIVVRLTVKVHVHVVYTSQVGHQATAYPGFFSMKQLEVFLLLDGMLVHYRVPPSIKLTSKHLYTPKWSETCPAQEHNTMAPMRTANSSRVRVH